MNPNDIERRLAEALRPFAALLQPHHDNIPSDRIVFAINDRAFTLHDLRRAADLLREFDNMHTGAAR